jgi:hypothetical protein
MPSKSTQSLITPGMAVHRRDDHAMRKHVSHFIPAGDFQHLPGESAGLLVMARVCVWPFR